jgi:hypothetical protein
MNKIELGGSNIPPNHAIVSLYTHPSGAQLAYTKRSKSYFLAFKSSDSDKFDLIKLGETYSYNEFKQAIDAMNHPNFKLNKVIGVQQ